MKKLLENSKMSAKIIALLVVLGAVTVFVAWNGTRQLISTDRDYSALVATKMVDTTILARANRNSTSMVYSAYRAVAYDAGSREARDAVAAEKAAYEAGKKNFSDVATAEPELAKEVEAFSARLDTLHALTQKAAAYGAADRNDEARATLVEVDNEMVAFQKDLTAYNDGRIAAAAKESASLTAQVEATTRNLMIIALLGIGGGIVLSLFVVKAGITTPIANLAKRMGEFAAGDYREGVPCAARGDELGVMGKAVLVFRDNGIAQQAAEAGRTQADAEQKRVVDTVSTHLSELASGDLTATITTDFPSEYATLKANFNEALDKLRELIGSVGESAATIGTGSHEIAQASEDLARRTESNAASLEETAASVTQMDGRLKASAAAASRTVERADQAIATVGGGRAVAEEAVQAMTRVSDSAKGIDSVIEGLDKIAFQTRVLAMNAAVEAGRAGDAGRGFAVVADLVSALAMRAEEEAKRARDQLTVTQTDIVTAVEAVTKVDGALANISGDVGQVHELLATMAADNQAQSAAITQISSAIGTMDQATQQNAAMVEETSAAARNLAAEVSGLTEQAGRFNTGKSAVATAKPVSSVPPKSRYADARAYASPVKPLPAAGIAALVRADDDWNAF